MRDIQRCAVTLSFVLLALVLASNNAHAAGIVGVVNVPPAFDTIAIDTSDEQRFLIDLIMTDYNGHDRIYMVQVNFYVGNEVTAGFAARFYDAPGMNSTFRYTDPAQMFYNTKGELLVLEECTVGTVPTTIYDDFFNLQVRFYFYPLEADSIEIICTDTQNASAIHVGPFPGNPGFLLESATLPISLSALGAAAAAATALFLRLKKNKVAQMVEDRIAGR